MGELKLSLYHVLLKKFKEPENNFWDIIVIRFHTKI